MKNLPPDHYFVEANGALDWINNKQRRYYQKEERRGFYHPSGDDRDWHPMTFDVFESDYLNHSSSPFYSTRTHRQNIIIINLYYFISSVTAVLYVSRYVK